MIKAIKEKVKDSIILVFSPTKTVKFNELWIRKDEYLACVKRLLYYYYQI